MSAGSIDRSEVPREPSRQAVSSRLAIMITSIVMLVGAMIFIWVATTSDESPAFLVLLVLAVWPVVACITSCAWARSCLGTIGIAMLTLVCVFVFFQIERGCLIEWYFQYPPTRPRFCNDFFLHERQLLPYWERPIPRTDPIRNCLLCDHADNLMVFASKFCRSKFDIRFEDDASRQDARDIPYWDDSGQTLEQRQTRAPVWIPRVRDLLIIVHENGTQTQIPIQSNTAQKIDEAFYSYMNNDPPSPALLDYIKTHLSSSERDKLEQSIADSVNENDEQSKATP